MVMRFCPPRKMAAAQKHCVISRQENMKLFSALGLPSFSPRVCTGRRTYADFRAKISRIDRLPNFHIHGAPLRPNSANSPSHFILGILWWTSIPSRGSSESPSHLCWVSCDGLASHPGEVVIHPVASCYRNGRKAAPVFWYTRRRGVT